MRPFYRLKVQSIIVTSLSLVFFGVFSSALPPLHLRIGRSGVSPAYFGARLTEGGAGLGYTDWLVSPSIVADLAAPIGPVLSGNFHNSHWAEGLLDGTAFQRKNSIGWMGGEKLAIPGADWFMPLPCKGVLGWWFVGVEHWPGVAKALTTAL